MPSVLSNEAVHYWFAKVNNGSRSKALQAIRVLLGDLESIGHGK
jgi:hypothetical protein